MAKNYYAILGITSDAKADEIRAAYRRLAKEFHPDRYPGGIHTFQQIQEAYSVLSDDQERRQYRKLPCQVDNCKIELPAFFEKYSAGVRSSRESWGRCSLYSIIHQ